MAWEKLHVPKGGMRHATPMVTLTAKTCTLNKSAREMMVSKSRYDLYIDNEDRRVGFSPSPTGGFRVPEATSCVRGLEIILVKLGVQRGESMEVRRETGSSPVRFYIRLPKQGGQA